MQVSVTVSDEILREANNRGISVVEFVENLIAKGLTATMSDHNALDSAINRIRALRSAAVPEKPAKGR